MNSDLRFGVVVSNNRLAAWQAQCIADLVQGGARFDVIVYRESDADPVTARHSVWRSFEAIAAKHVPGLRPVDWRREYPDIARVPTTPTGSGLAVSPAAQATLRERRLGFLLNFTDQSVGPELADLSIAGVWSFQLNDAARYDGRIPAFWELCHGDHLIQCALVRETHLGPVVLRKGTFRSVVDSYVATASTALNACIPWPRLVWRDRMSSMRALDDPRRLCKPTLSDVDPTMFQVVMFFVRLWGARLRLMFKWWLYREQWCVGIIDQPIHALIGAARITNVKWLFRDERHRYFADPFGIADGDTITVLAEEYPATTNRGKISTFVVRDGAIVRDPAVVLELDGHLSYPYLLRHEGKLYCVPESNELGETTLYEITRFPDRWTKVRTLLRGKYVDPTLFQHDGRWWLLATSMEHEGVTTLYIWHATDLLGDWTPHTANPVKMDVCSSRPAGAPFMYKGQLYRPAQNCGVTYGGGIALTRITRLTIDEFEEEVVTQLEPERPGPFPLGLHTLSAVGERTLIDGKTYLLSLEQFRSVLRAKLRRVFGMCTATQP